LRAGLIFVEGLPGAGKTTTSKYVVDRLRRAGRAAEWLAEAETDHPLNVGGELHPAGSTTGDELFRRYTVQTYIDESLERRRTFAAAPDWSSTVMVLDSYPYQNAARILLQMDAETGVIRAYARELEAIARPLSPVLIFLHRSMTAEALSGTARARGEAWTAYAIDVITGCPYARHRQLSGIDGAMVMLGAYNALVQQLLGESETPRLVLDRCDGHWDGCYARIETFLGLPAAP
jgi:hypothetical protein